MRLLSPLATRVYCHLGLDSYDSCEDVETISTGGEMNATANGVTTRALSLPEELILMLLNEENG